MRLCDALGIRRGDVVSLVGAGGKTTTMYRLARELAEQGWRVVTTTTTMIRPAPPPVIVASDREQAMIGVRQALSLHTPVSLASQYLTEHNKLKGIDPAWVAPLKEMADVVIIEADGAKGLSLKAPAAYEPVVPPLTSILVPVVGIDVIGQHLKEGTVHRPSLVAALTGLAPGDLIGTTAVATLLVHPQGALKGAPEGSRVVLLINKAEDEATREIARRVAGQVQRHPAVDRVLIAAVARDDPVAECWRPVAAIVLAAGGSTRLGRPKQLLPLAGGTVIGKVLETAAGTGVHQVIVVLGHAADQVAGYVPEGCRVIENAEWESGVSSSIRAGLAAVSARSEAALFVLADQPCITQEAITRILLAYYGTDKSIIVPTCGGQRRSPVLFDRRHFAALQTLRGDSGGREVMAACPDDVLPVEIEAPELFLDIDTPEDYHRLLTTSERQLPDRKDNS